MPDPVRSPSSIPMPDELVEWYAREMAGKCDGISVFDDECSMPANDATKALYRHDARDYLDEIGSRLYAHWAERRHDGATAAISLALRDPARYVEREHYGVADPESLTSWQARAVVAALGLEDRT